jgi:hypothetical protein
LALKLHRYAYTGLYRGASDYVDKNDAIEDLKVLIRKITELISSLGKSEDSKKILNKLENINK